MRDESLYERTTTLTERKMFTIDLSPPEGLSCWLNSRPTDQSVGYDRLSQGDKAKGGYDAVLTPTAVLSAKIPYDVDPSELLRSLLIKTRGPPDDLRPS